MDVAEQSGGFRLEGILTIPEGSRALVVFAHGSGISRLSPRNQIVARILNEEGLATLFFDLLTREEESIDLRTRPLRFDIVLLARRLTGTIDWAVDNNNAGAANRTVRFQHWRCGRIDGGCAPTRGRGCW